jgi:multidrug efflux pump subunit AcrA (membrane-fusion protein)
MTGVTFGTMLRRAWFFPVLIVASVTCSTAGAETFNGSVAWRHVAELRAGVSGRLASAALVPGARFAAGDELATIETALYEAYLGNAREQLDLAQQEYDWVSQEVEREQVLYEEGSLSQVDFDHFSLQLKRAAAALRQAHTDMTAARYHAELSRLNAPFDGVVLEAPAVQGQFLNAAVSAPLIGIIAESGKFAARAGVSAEARRAVTVGSPARVSIGDTAFDGLVGAVRWVGENGTGWEVDVYFDATTEDVVAGLEALVELP